MNPSQAAQRPAPTADAPDQQTASVPEQPTFAFDAAMDILVPTRRATGTQHQG